MSYLLYCVFGEPPQPSLEIPSRVGGRQVFVVAQNGLSAVLSELGEAGVECDVSGILEYDSIVEAFDRHLTVIPVRYGCFFEGLSDAVASLERRHDEYVSLLQRLAGMREMAIHVLPDRPNDKSDAGLKVTSPESAPIFCNTGADYLAARRRYYLALDRAALDRRLLIEEVCESLSGFYLRRNVRFPDSAGGRLLSTYFLVPRELVENFRRAARALRLRDGSKLLLSGPWPPYNFVEDPLQSAGDQAPSNQCTHAME